MLILLCFQVQVAIKCLTKEKLHTGTTEFLKEANIMQNIEHENIVRMYGVVLDKDDSLMLVCRKINWML
jgi:serine/threonine protein kinase